MVPRFDQSPYRTRQDVDEPRTFAICDSLEERSASRELIARSPMQVAIGQIQEYHPSDRNVEMRSRGDVVVGTPWKG